MDSSARTEKSMAVAAAPTLGLGAWNLYFLVKFGLYWKELIGFHALENLAFALVLLIPVASAHLRRARAIAAIPVGIALLYYDSWLPPFSRALSQASLLANFSLPYLLELAGRFVSIPALAALVVIGALYLILVRWIRFSVLVVAALGGLLADDYRPHAPRSAATAGDPAPGSAIAIADPDAALKTFFAHEATRTVAMKRPPADAAPFDVIFLHVCSLSWDDLQAMGLENHPLLKRFDVMLTRFNSAATYSGPAAIRIQRATCGQQAHGSLYNPTTTNCYLMESLRQAGFAPELVLNHDGHFDDFIKFVQAQGGMQVPPLPLEGLAVAQHSFDGSPIYADRAVLARWLERRAQNPAERTATYFNTVSLHDGNRISGSGAAASSLDTYKLRLTQLLDDLNDFFDALEKSGRRAVVALIPEHGAAVRGDKMQIAGLREIPSPAITLVPVGIKVLGARAAQGGGPVRVTEPTSYLAVAELVARLAARPPFGADSFAPADYVADLPTTPLVAQNENIIVMARGDRYLLKQGNDAWTDYKISP